VTRATAELFHAETARRREELAPGAVLLRGFAKERDRSLLAAIEAIAAAAPFRRMVTPGGHTMSVAMTSCGLAGWVTGHMGYRYASHDPESGKPWPKMPKVMRDLAVEAAAAGGFPGFAPDSCLINLYEPGARLGLHQDKDEADMSAPIVSVSLGLPAKFLFGGLKRNDRIVRTMLEHGDAVVWGGAARLAFHGIDTLKEGEHPVLGHCRINLTFRTAL
jgi:alkylated DNA repair protein (DNA oxidative demethylase)